MILYEQITLFMKIQYFTFVFWSKPQFFDWKIDFCNERTKTIGNTNLQIAKSGSAEGAKPLGCLENAPEWPQDGSRWDSFTFGFLVNSWRSGKSTVMMVCSGSPRFGSVRFRSASVRSGSSSLQFQFVPVPIRVFWSTNRFWCQKANRVFIKFGYRQIDFRCLKRSQFMPRSKQTVKFYFFISEAYISFQILILSLL